jgi:hypothetical protein
MSAGQAVPSITDQNRNTTASCAWIDATPAMPNLTVQVVSTYDGTPAPGTASYQLNVSFDWINRDPSAKTITTWQEHDFHSIVPTTVSAGSPWTVPWPSNCGASGTSPCFFGGYADLYWTYAADANSAAQSQPPYYFYICGRNPDYGTALSYVDSLLNPPYWMGQKLAWHETGVSQFCEAGSGRAASDYCAPSQSHEGWPIFGPPAGYGLLQRDPLPKPTAAQIMWNWQEAIASGRSETDGLAGLAYPFWQNQVQQWNDWNDQQRRMNPPGHIVPPPPDQVEAGGVCTFRLPVDPSGRGSTVPITGAQGIYWFGDAILIKRFNGITYTWPTPGSTPVNGNYPQSAHSQNYIAWQNRGSNATNPYWGIFKANTVSLNTTAEVCSCYGPPRTCSRYGLPSRNDPVNRVSWDQLEIRIQ